ncbi:MAG: C4-dicarboxylate ABC transporter [Rickettsiales bacterium]|nr:C4-dicarboxylate ABC transporter [Rickettsiales bacterium]|tara:strand:- start:972 stop:3557 length:2586 start_codon:yes stop_codon:yes gene_type:complete
MTDDKDVQDLVIEQDSGARDPRGLAKYVLFYAALLWSLFQLWIASPLPFELGFGIFNNTESRAIHLGFAMFLAFTAYPTFRRSPRSYIPLQDWVMAIVGAFCSLYLFIFYNELATRPGLPTDLDIATACVGIVLLLEAARRSLGLPLTIVGAVFLIYTFFGSAEWMPELIQHKGQSFQKVASHMWLTTEGVFGIALGVSTDFVFLFVLFGALLDKAGAGNYFIKVAFSLLGHLRGGPAKAAVLASGLTGFISGSSIANVVTTGTFTIPLMKRVGFTAEKAGAVEVAGSVNGQIMPPVMGAAAFIMMDFIGISLREVIKHALIPAVISYIALLYIVHLEALKSGMTALEKPQTSSLKMKLIAWGIIIASMVILLGGAYYLLDFAQAQFGPAAIWVTISLLVIWYLATIKWAARYPDLEPDDPNSDMVELPETAPTVKTGLHYLIPVVVLVWSLMVERLSPGLSAFWASVVMIVILLTQRPLLVLFRKAGDMKHAFRAGGSDLVDGLISGARNMIGIGIATAAAGIVVGTVSLTGIGQIMTEIVEVLSGGSLILVLIFTAIISLILGMGLPTTANYVVVSSIMVGVVLELGKQHGLIVPAIAVHLFVFYFGIMADVTPPVGLASFAAAAISKGDPIKTGFQAFIYSTRTAILPFFFIFNTQIILVGVDSIPQGIAIFVASTIAILVFSAAMQGYFLTRSRIYESALLLVVAVVFFIPNVVMNEISPRLQKKSGSEIEQVIMEIPVGERFRVHIKGEDALGDVWERDVLFDVPEGATAEERLKKLGLIVTTDKSVAEIEEVPFLTPADDKEIFPGDLVLHLYEPKDQPDPRLLYIPALLVLFGVMAMQRRRERQRVHISQESVA